MARLPAGAETVASRTRDRLSDFSASERKVARTLLAAYPAAGLETVAQLAERAKVSPPTVVRFIARLGFSGYPAFQQALIREVHERMGSPLEQYAEKKRATVGKELLPYAASTFIDMLQASFAELPDAEFVRAVDAMCDVRRRACLVGGQFSGLLAQYLATHLQLMRKGVDVVGETAEDRAAVVADADRGMVLVVFDYRRYDPDVVHFAELVAERGAEVVLLTDRWLSPIADVAHVVLPARVEAPSPFDSLVSPMAVVESLVAAVTGRLGEDGRRRLEAMEAIREVMRAAPGTHQG